MTDKQSVKVYHDADDFMGDGMGADFVLKYEYDILLQELKDYREALEKADETMRIARQTAFEASFRDILWQGTKNILEVLNKYKAKSGVGEV